MAEIITNGHKTVENIDEINTEIIGGVKTDFKNRAEDDNKLERNVINIKSNMEETHIDTKLNNNSFETKDTSAKESNEIVELLTDNISTTLPTETENDKENKNKEMTTPIGATQTTERKLIDDIISEVIREHLNESDKKQTTPHMEQAEFLKTTDNKDNNEQITDNLTDTDNVRNDDNVINDDGNKEINNTSESIITSVTESEITDVVADTTSSNNIQVSINEDSQNLLCTDEEEEKRNLEVVNDKSPTVKVIGDLEKLATNYVTDDILTNTDSPSTVNKNLHKVKIDESPADFKEDWEETEEIVKVDNMLDVDDIIEVDNTIPEVNTYVDSPMEIKTTDVLADVPVIAVPSTSVFVDTDVAVVDSTSVSVDTDIATLDSTNVPVDITEGEIIQHKDGSVDKEELTIDTVSNIPTDKTVDSTSISVDTDVTAVDSASVSVDTNISAVDSTSVFVDTDVTAVDSASVSVDTNISAVDSTSVSVDTDVTASDSDEVKEPEWMDILGNGMLKKKVLKKGNGQESRPVTGDIVVIRCEGKLSDGTIVDKNSHLQFILGDGDIIQALDMCVALMGDKETCTLYTDARYAYSIFGRPDYQPPIPQNAHLTYELEILSITEGPSVEQLSPQDRVLYSDKKRTRGNDLYARNNFSGAIDAYKRGLKYLQGNSDKIVLDMKVKCLNNLSAAQLKVKAYVMALQSLDVVISLEPENVKAIFRKGKCLEGLGKDEDALNCMKKASILDPQNKQIVQDLGRLRSKVAVTHKKEKEIYQRMFSQNKKRNSDDGEEEEYEDEETSLWPFIGSAMVAGVAIVGGLLWHKYR